MDLLGTTGLLGFLTFLWFLGSVLRSYLWALRSPQMTPEDRGLLLGSWAAFVCFIIGAAFDSHLYHTQTLSMMLYGLALGQAVVLSVKQKVHREAPVAHAFAGVPIHSSLPALT
jgi:hypothetical protein